MLQTTAADVTGTTTVSAPNPVPGKQTDKVESGQSATDAQAQAQPDEAVSPKFAALARKEKLVRQRERDLQAREQALKAREETFNKPAPAQQDDWRKRLAKDPVSVFQEAGLSGDELTAAILNAPKSEDIKFQKLQSELEALRAEQAQSVEEQKKRQADSYEQAKKQMRTDVSRLVDQDDQFEAIKASGDNAKDAVVALIEATFHEEGYVMPLSEAALAVEEHLVEQALALARMKKVQAKLAPAPATTEKVETAPQKTALSQQTHTQQQPNTLSNRMTQNAPKGLSWSEKRARAIAAFKGQPLG